MRPATPPPDRPFFVGYINGVPRDHLLLLSATIFAVLALFALLGTLLGAGTPYPGDGRFGSEMTVTGVIEHNPYPLLRVPADAAHPRGRAILLAGEDKTGVQAAAKRLAGQAVAVQGYHLTRGSLEMLLVNQATGFTPAGSGSVPVRPVAGPLGRWRMEGEICDGKCYAGAMQPGTGLAHKACANLCISGGVPPVFVTDKPLEGTIFFLLAAADGGPAPATLYDFVGQPVALEGEIVRLDDILVFRVDWSKVRLR